LSTDFNFFQYTGSKGIGRRLSKSVTCHTYDGEANQYFYLHIKCDLGMFRKGRAAHTQST